MQLPIVRGLGIAVIAAMAIFIVSGMLSGGFVDGLEMVLDDPWGRVTLVDLASGLVLAGAWIGWREASLLRAIPWWLAMALTGNLAFGIYVVWASGSSRSVHELLVGSTA